MGLMPKSAMIFGLIFGLIAWTAPVYAQGPLSPGEPPVSLHATSSWVEPPPRSGPAAEPILAAPEQPAPGPQVQGPAPPPQQEQRNAYRRSYGKPAARSRTAYRLNRQQIARMRYGAMSAYDPHLFGPSPNRSSGN
jgi:hypothetical protein